MDLWIISAFEPTPIDNTRPMRFMGIADAAIARGHKVTFFTKSFRHSTRVQRFEEDTFKEVKPGYDLVFLHSRPYRKNISFERMKAHYDFAQSLLKEAKKRKKPDMIFISLPPLSTVLNMVQWGKANGIPVVVDIIDPWPDGFLKPVPKAGKPIAKMLLTPFYAKLRTIINGVSGITAISREYVDWALSYSLMAKPSAPFYPAVKFAEIQSLLANQPAEIKQQKDDKLRLIYAGSFASSYDIPTILKAAEILDSKYPGKTEFVLAGLGPQKDLVEAYVAKLSNIKYVGRLGFHELISQFYLADIGLIQHITGATQTVTYKLFDYLGAGLPILNSLQSEMVQIITDNKVGFNNEPGDAEGLVKNVERFLNDKGLLQQYKENALKLTSKEGDADVVYRDLIVFLESLT